MEKKIYKQKGPTCAIYSFLNGCFFDFSFSQKEVDKVAFRLLREATQGYSFIGEFFSSGKLAEFLKNQEQIKVKQIEKLSVNSVIELAENEFLLVPISVIKAFSEKMLFGMHWVCVIKRGNQYLLLDSEKRVIDKINNLEGYITFNQSFFCEGFDWNLWLKYFTFSLGSQVFYKKYVYPYYMRKYINEQLSLKKKQIQEIVTEYDDIRILKVSI